jgi:hypothetical protein
VHRPATPSGGVSEPIAGGQRGDSERVKDPLARLVDEIIVESRACIQPYFILPGVRTPIGSRRETGIEPTRLNPGSTPAQGRKNGRR